MSEITTAEADSSTVDSSSVLEQDDSIIPKIEHVEPVLSKRQLRKAEKQRLWEATRSFRKENRKKRKQMQRDRRKREREQLKAEAVKEGLDPATVAPPPTRKKLKSNLMQHSSCKVGICVDMSFSDLMQEKDRLKCVKQLSRCYSANRRFKNPIQFYVTSLTGQSVETMDKQDGWRNWDVHFHEKSYLEIEEYPKEKVVYLTAESENVLMEPEDNTLYVIGGLVDHNHNKGLCHKLAVEKGVRHARLPLGEFVQMNRRKVLSILHVFQILGGVAQNRPWEEVLMEVLPPRNHAKLKITSSDDDSSSEDDQDHTDKNAVSTNDNSASTSQDNHPVVKQEQD